MVHPHVDPAPKPAKKSKVTARFVPADVELSPSTIAVLQRRKVNAAGVGCFLCSLILEDFEKHGKLTWHPKDTSTGEAGFPINGKLDHLELELKRKIVFES